MKILKKKCFDMTTWKNNEMNKINYKFIINNVKLENWKKQYFVLDGKMWWSYSKTYLLFEIVQNSKFWNERKSLNLNNFKIKNNMLATNLMP